MEGGALTTVDGRVRLGGSGNEADSEDEKGKEGTHDLRGRG